MIATFFFLFAIAGMILGTIFWIFMIVECATREADTGNTKIVWIIIVVFTHILGALLYYFVRRPERERERRGRGLVPRSASGSDV